MKCFSIFLLFSALFSSISTSLAVDTIKPNQVIKDGYTIVSAGGEFELGFFSPGKSTNRYVGIWYKKISHGTVVWVANRDTPLTNHSGMVRVNRNGILVLNDGDGRTIWSSNSSRSLTNPIAQLLDTGNLVLRDEKDSDPENFLWQSFDYPGDTFLPGMKMGVDLVKGLNRQYTSWKSADDPSVGSYMYCLDPNGFPQVFKWKGSMLWSRTGPWSGTQFSGDPIKKPNSIFKYEFVLNKKEIYYKIELVSKSSSVTTRYTMAPDGELEVLIWNDQNQNWIVYSTVVVRDCDRYGFCGANGVCNINSSPRCECIQGFVPKFPGKWKVADWSDGCVRKTQLDCGSGEGFMKHSVMKLPDTRRSWYNMTINLEACGRECLKNCSCTAYANADVRRGGSGCILWFDELIDTTAFTTFGQDIYVRMPAAELGYAENRRFRRGMLIIVIPAIPTVLLGLFFFLFRKGVLKRGGRLKSSTGRAFTYKNDSKDFDLPFVDFKSITNATNNFYQNNKLGEGGFGPVYKGVLEDGKEIAVKRLSDNSGQGVAEFLNEVSLIAKLQHRNLVALLGCCMEKGERILIYEYMSNKSLDSLIFDEDSSKLLDWPKHYKIINGIARGLLYLHQDSKLRIIHRDLKPSNILLDQKMNPKISDFGMARSLGGTQTEANTKRVVGTYGYMPPEYVIDGQFSVKSDVYSFGVLVIEMTSGKKNRLYDHPDHNLNLLGHAWRSYQEDKLLRLIDGAILESGKQNEVLRVIQIGLLCVQQNPEDRPSMSYVVLMFSNIALPQPKQPGFFTERRLHKIDNSLTKPLYSSFNHPTVTVLTPRL